jgi:hypothetical protein
LLLDNYRIIIWEQIHKNRNYKTQRAQVVAISLLHAMSMITIASRAPCQVLHHQANLLLLRVLLLHLHGQERASSMINLQRIYTDSSTSGLTTCILGHMKNQLPAGTQ